MYTRIANASNIFPKNWNFIRILDNRFSFHDQFAALRKKG